MNFFGCCAHASTQWPLHYHTDIPIETGDIRSYPGFDDIGPNMATYVWRQRRVIHFWMRSCSISPNLKDIADLIHRFARLIGDEIMERPNTFFFIEWTASWRNKDIRRIIEFRLDDAHVLRMYEYDVLDRSGKPAQQKDVVRSFQRTQDRRSIEVNFQDRRSIRATISLSQNAEQRLVDFANGKGVLIEEASLSYDMYMATYMFHETSGRSGYDLMTTSVNDELLERFPRETILAMLRHENKLRLEQDFLKKLDEDAAKGYPINARAKNERGGWDAIYCPDFDRLQFETIRHFGFIEEDLETAVHVLRCAGSIFPEDEEIRRAAMYLEFNRAKECLIGLGDKMKDVKLFTCSGEETSLMNILSRDMPTLVIAGSIT